MDKVLPTQAAATAYLIPLFGVFFGWLIRDELLGRVELVGGALVVVGVCIVVTAANRGGPVRRGAAARDDVVTRPAAR